MCGCIFLSAIDSFSHTLLHFTFSFYFILLFGIDATRHIQLVCADTDRAREIRDAIRQTIEQIAPNTVWIEDALGAGAGDDAPTHTLVLLTKSILLEGSVSKDALESLTAHPATKNGARPIVYVYLDRACAEAEIEKEEEGGADDDAVSRDSEAWSFNAGGVYSMLAEGDVKESIGSHEGLKYRAPAPAPMRYEHDALCKEILRRMR